MYDFNNITLNKLLLYLLFTQDATEIASEYLATNHDQKDDIAELTVDVLLKVRFDIIDFG